MRTRSHARSCGVLLAFAIAPSGALAQCATSWAGTMPPPNSSAWCIAALPNGDVVVGGQFASIGGVPASRIARWDGTAVQALAAGMDLAVTDLTVLPNGDLVAVGAFTTPANGVARWNGSAWSPIGSGIPNALRVAAAPNGDIWVVGSGGGVSRWDGTSWSFVPGSFVGGVRAVTVDENGAVYVSSEGQFFAPIAWPGHVYQWSGTVWVDLGATGVVGVGGGGSASTLAPRRGGGCHAAGSFQQIAGMPASNFATWNGAAWVAGPGLSGINALLPLSDGTVVSTGLSGTRRSDGASWTAFGGGMTGIAADLALAPNGDVLMVGGFTQVGGNPSNGYARLASNCPASAITSGTACTASAGPMTLTANVLPWLGATCRTQCTGFAATSIGLGVLGFSATSVPLAAILPVGLPGCDLLASPDVLATLLPVAGKVDFAVAIPIAPALVGGTFHEQVVQIELNALQITGLVGSNALTLTIGQY